MTIDVVVGMVRLLVILRVRGNIVVELGPRSLVGILSLSVFSLLVSRC